MARILVADDEAGIREFMGETLSLAKHHVDLAADGQEAIDLLMQHTYDVLLCDLKMPRQDGMAVLACAQDIQPLLKVIMISAHGTIDVAVEAMKQGAYDYIQKPIPSLRALRLVVERAVEHQVLERQQDVQRTQRATRQLTWGSPKMAAVVTQLERVAPLPSTVLLTGDSGTGKEVAAQSIHDMSARANGPFVAINCAAISPHLLESELFGHERGAFTGAERQKRGRFEMAHGGTCFLDELGELPLEMQSKLLRVLEQRHFMRVGGTQSIHVDVRWIAATNRPLAQMVESGAFRADLYHRLAVFPVHLPTLRERAEDILPLAKHLLVDIAASLGRGPLTLSDPASARLCVYEWPGNVRELRNVLERAAIMSESSTLDAPLFDGLADGLTTSTQLPPAALQDLKEIERQAIINTMNATDGNRTHSAKILGIGVRTLYDKLKRYGLDDRW